MWHVAGAECYERGMESKVACQPLILLRSRSRGLHDLLMKEQSMVDVLGCEEDEEEGFTNIITVRGGGHLMIPG
jgi:hypothetical protein